MPPSTKASARKSSPKRKRKDEIVLPPEGDWRTTDEDEINRRRLRALEEPMTLQNLAPHLPVHSNFQITGGSGVTYEVEIRDVPGREFHCTCMDFRINGLGTCKHIESTLAQLAIRWKKQWPALSQQKSPRVEIILDRDHSTLAMRGERKRLPSVFRPLFDSRGLLSAGWEPEKAMERLREAPEEKVRVSLAINPWLERRRHEMERTLLRREYEVGVVNGEQPPHETLVPLYPYQREGMMHLAFTGRALLADEMGLGKTIQAIAACALLHRLGRARRVLVITPASLKTEWEEQISKFTTLDYQIVYGARLPRLRHYREDAPFFTLMNYEQIRTDVLDLNTRLKPDIVVLDEAQRIKNWASKTARSVKMLRSRFAFVLTGTPLENRIDELYSLVDFLDPEVFGSLFRFNREFFTFDEKGRPEGCRNLQQLHERVRPLMLRRRKSDVEDELPGRTDENRFVTMSDEQRAAYEGPEARAAKLSAIAKKRPLRKEEQEKLMRDLAMMRMICDSAYVIDSTARECPKLNELRSILEDCLDEPEVKVIIFSEWVRMLDLVRGLLDDMGIKFALHTGQVSQQRRRGEIIAFKTDPACRVILCTESGGAGLNLQNASVVINCDLPWNPAKLEQRIARAWRKHQKRAVTVINLITEKSIEHGMLETLAMKQGLAEGVLDNRDGLDSLKLRGGAQNFMARLHLILAAQPEEKAKAAMHKPPTDPPRAFAAACARVAGTHLVECRECYTAQSGSCITVTVDRDAQSWQPKLEQLFAESMASGPSTEPARLVVMDRATAHAVEALVAAGLLQHTERAARPLLPGDGAGASIPRLTPEQRERAADFVQRLANRLKAARLLHEGGCAEDAVMPLQQALLPAASALSIIHHLQPPATGDAVLQEPWLALWPENAHDALRAFHESNPASAVEPLLVALEDAAALVRKKM